MLFLINPRAAGGRAIGRWATVRRTICPSDVDRDEIILDGAAGLDAVVSAALLRGERNFVAVGGDGTVNALLNSLLGSRHRGGTGADRGVAMGAVGLGSSNDFHKRAGIPPQAVPSRIDFSSTRAEDVGCIDAAGIGGFVRRYFIVNASAGVTAEGNLIFNGTAGAMPALRRLGAWAAIPAAALLAIGRHANVPAAISVDGGPERTVTLSNLALLRNTNISGRLRLDAIERGGPETGDGPMGLWIEENRSRRHLLGLFVRLLTGRFRPADGTTLGRCFSVRVRAAAPIPVEFDGEILFTGDATFSVVRHAIRVCR